jgi:hypothetical protein
MPVYKHKGKWMYDFYGRTSAVQAGRVPGQRRSEGCRGEGAEHANLINMDFVKLCERQIEGGRNKAK